MGGQFPPPEANHVDLSSDQIVSGEKTFQRAKGTGDPILGVDLATKDYVDSAPPAGSAGGDLSGTYPNPILANSVVSGNKVQASAILQGHVENGYVDLTSDQTISGIKTFFRPRAAGDPIDSTDLATKSYVDASAVSPAGSDTQIQFNSGGSFGASSGFTFSSGVCTASTGFRGVSFHRSGATTGMSVTSSTVFFFAAGGSAGDFLSTAPTRFRANRFQPLTAGSEGTPTYMMSTSATTTGWFGTSTIQGSITGTARYNLGANDFTHTGGNFTTRWTLFADATQSSAPPELRIRSGDDAAVADRIFARLSFNTHDGSSIGATPATIDIVADSLWTDSNHATRFEFRPINTGSTSPITRMVLDVDGTLVVGGSKASAVDGKIRAGSADGTNITAKNNLTLHGGQGTGAGAGGGVILAYAPVGTSGSSVNTVTAALTLDGNDGSVSISRVGENNEVVGAGSGLLMESTASGNSIFGDNSANTLEDGSHNTIVGESSDVAASNTTGGTSLGRNTTVHQESVVLGLNAASTAVSQFVLGAAGFGISNGYFGNGVVSTTADLTSFTINSTGGSGTDVGGSALNVAGGRGTGSADGGDLNLQYAPPGTTGSSLNSLATALAIDGGEGTAVFTPNASTELPASTEAPDFDFQLNRTVQFATGALTDQRAVKFAAPTYGFVGASVITRAATVYIDAAPVAGTNATINNSYALWVDDGVTRLDSAVPLGGGSAPTFGTISGLGPTVAAQNEWIEVHTQNGARFIPAWA